MGNKTLLVVMAFLFIILFFILYPQQVSYADKDELSKALPIKACTQDSDCVLTGSGACGGEACPIAINQKYKTIWESTPDSQEYENNCAVVGMCFPSGMENYTARCVDNICGVLPKILF